MLGFNAFAVQPFSAVSSVFFGSSTQSFNFTETSAAIKIGVSSAEMSGIASKQSVGVGILSGIADISGNFVDDTDAIKIAAGTSAIEFLSDNTQTSVAERIRLASADQSAIFTKTTDGIKIAITSADISFNNTQTTVGNATFSGDADISFINTNRCLR